MSYILNISVSVEPVHFDGENMNELVNFHYFFGRGGGEGRKRLIVEFNMFGVLRINHFSKRRSGLF